MLELSVQEVDNQAAAVEQVLSVGQDQAVQVQPLLMEQLMQAAALEVMVQGQQQAAVALHPQEMEQMVLAAAAAAEKAEPQEKEVQA